MASSGDEASDSEVSEAGNPFLGLAGSDSDSDESDSGSDRDDGEPRAGAALCGATMPGKEAATATGLAKAGNAGSQGAGTPARGSKPGAGAPRRSNATSAATAEAEDEAAGEVTSAGEIAEDAESESDADAEQEEFLEDENSDGPHDEQSISDFQDLVGKEVANGQAVSQALVDAVLQLVGPDRRPTPIQSLCWEILLDPSTASRDLIAIAKTGSGKTLAFLLPVLTALTAPGSEAESSDDLFVQPRAIAMAPTRELAQQIAVVADDLVRSTEDLQFNVLAVLGGEAFHQQLDRVMAARPRLVIATPGRFVDLCGKDAESMCFQLHEVELVVLDEADRMLNLGFSQELGFFAQLLRSKSRHSVQFILTSATWTEQTADGLKPFIAGRELPPVYLSVGGAGQTLTPNVTQRVEMMSHKGAPRFKRLVGLLRQIFANKPSTRVIVFALHKGEAKQVAKDLDAQGIPSVALQGDMSQSARREAIAAFRGSEGPQVLVATDVAARGLDVRGVSDVINFSLGISIENFIHRCGRTGRAGQYGTAHTFFLKEDSKLAPDLCAVLDKAHQQVPVDLRIVANKELKRRSRGDGVGPSAVDSDEEELRRANRQKQLERGSGRVTRKGGNARRGGRKGRR